MRAARLLKARAGDFDVVHDNQTLGYGMLSLAKAGLPLIATVHHPVSVDRVVEIANAANLRQALGKRRWYAFTRMQGRVARRMSSIVTVSTNSGVGHRPRLRGRPGRHAGGPDRRRHHNLPAAHRAAGPRAGSSRSRAPTARSRA